MIAIPEELENELADAWDKCASDTATPDDYQHLNDVRVLVEEAQREEAVVKENES